MVYKFKPLDKNKFASDKMRLFTEEVNDVLTDRFFTKQELTEWVQRIPRLFLSYEPIDLHLYSDFEKWGDETIDNFLKRVDELGFAVDFVVSDRRTFVTKQNGELIMTIDYDEDLENGYVAEKGFYEVGEYYQIQLDKLVGETNFASLWEE